MFSATDAAFSGFRAAREHFRAVLVWMLVFGLTSVAMIWLLVPLGGPLLVELEALQGQADVDPQVALDLLGRLGVVFLPLVIPGLLISAVQSAGVNRMILEPGDSRFGYLRLGGDELRQLVVTLLLMLVFIGMEIGGVAVIALLVVAAAAINPGLAVLVGIVGGVGWIAALLVVLIRLSLANSQTFASRRINLFGSWSLTKGRLWPMVGAYLLAGIMFMIASTAVQAIAMLAVFLGGGGFAGVGVAQSPDFSSLSAFLTRPMLINLAITLIANPFLQLIVLCPAPDIYRALTASGPP